MSDERVVPASGDGSTSDSVADEGLSIAELCLLYQNDNTHTFFVSDLATLLFERTSSAHRLPASCLPILQAGAKLHNIGLHSNPAQHHTAGKEIVLEHGIAGFTEMERRTIALSVLFHRKTPRLRTEPLLLQLSHDERQQALRLAAIVRVADGLDYSQDQTARFTHLDDTRRRLCLFLDGNSPHAQSNADRTNEKSDLWNTVMERGIRFRVDDGRKYYLRPGDTMQTAGYKSLAHFYENILSAESGAQTGDDIEELHRFRVAIRRLRSGLRVFRNIYATELVLAMESDLSLLMDATGEVRDMDVFLSVLGDLTDVDRVPTFLTHLHQLRKQRQEAMRAALNDEPFQRFKAMFVDTVANRHPFESPMETKEAAKKVRRAVPKILKKRLARVLVFHEGLDIENVEQLHSLRIACKRFRYTADVFSEVLEAGRSLLVRPFTELQDSLGEIHDAAVRRGYVVRFLDEHGSHIGDEERSCLHLLLEMNEVRRAQFSEQFGERWARFVDSEFQSALVEAFRSVRP